MCLAVPVQIKSINGNEAEADFGGINRKISIMLTPEVKVGDYVLLHTAMLSMSLVPKRLKKRLSCLVK